jgi:large subunit ribosomal protein L22
MEVKAVLNNLRVSPRKVRLAANLIKGQDVLHAQNQLKYLGKKSASHILKLLNSAIANADKNFKIPKNNLFVKTIFVDAGPMLKRWLPRAHGRATMLRKRTSRITLILEEKASTQAAARLQKDSTKQPMIEQKQAPVDTKKQEKSQELDLDKPFVAEEDKNETKQADMPAEVDLKKEKTRQGWQGKSQEKKSQGIGGAINKIFRRKSI